MRKIQVLIALLFTVSVSYAQIDGKKVKGSVTILDSISVNPGDTLYFGSGSDRVGDFAYVYQPANFLMGTKEENMHRRYSNKYAIVKHFKVQKDKRTGEKTIAVINPAGGLNYIADIEGAILANEIVAINSRKVGKKEEPKVVIQQVAPSSVADELAKLKKLHDDGVLSKDEYDAQKKKLLGN